MEIKRMESSLSTVATDNSTTERSKGKVEDEMLVNIPNVVDNSQDKFPQDLDSPDKSTQTGQVGNLSTPLLDTSGDLLSESPLDLTIPKTRKRKFGEVDLTNDPAVGEARDSIYKRREPSLISFARPKSRRIEILTNADPADHFLRALGPQLYKMIYGTARDSFVGRLHSWTFSRPVQDGKIQFNREGLSVDEHFRKSLGTKTWMELQGF
ncbi:unnamed protein product [Allacma fusca]|uniref:Uncharacterized protein n=1 Tax=Allacma fusca TaxID=39272 RepID=A0A8J2JZ27_9HEXA|nr:unnamed protein product [Allacma fusca]